MARKRSPPRTGAPVEAPPPRASWTAWALGLSISLIPWIAFTGAPTHDTLSDQKWLAVSVAAILILGASLLDPRPARGSGVDRYFYVGASLIAVGLCVSTLLSPAMSLGVRVSLRELMFVLLACRLATVGWNARSISVVMALYLASAAAQAAFTILQWAAPGDEARSRALMVGTIGNPEYVAGWMAPALAAAFVWLGMSGVSRRGRGLLLVVIAVIGFSVSLSGGRGAALGAVGGIAIVLMLRRLPSFRSGEGERYASRSGGAQ